MLLDNVSKMEMLHPLDCILHYTVGVYQVCQSPYQVIEHYNFSLNMKECGILLILLINLTEFCAACKTPNSAKDSFTSRYPEKSYLVNEQDSMLDQTPIYNTTERNATETANMSSTATIETTTDENKNEDEGDTINLILAGAGGGGLVIIALTLKSLIKR